MNSDNKKLRLEKVNMDNWVPLVRLKVKRDQQSFVASNVGSLAEAYVATISGGYPQPFGIYRGDKPIGFLMIGYYPSLEYAKKYAEEGEATPYFMDKSYLIWRFMIDKKYQGKGIGKIIVTSLIKELTDYVCVGECFQLEASPTANNRDFYIKCGLKYKPENQDGVYLWIRK